MKEMEQNENAKSGKISSSPRVVAIAVNGGSKSEYIVKWALEKFGALGPVSFKLVHVLSKITGVPTPMGNSIPFAQVRDDVVAAYKKEIEWQKKEMILPYQRMLTQQKVIAEVVMLESDEIWKAISKEIASGDIKDLVIGASSNSLFARKFRGQSVSSLILESAPSFCAVYVVSKGKLENVRPSVVDQAHRTSVEYDSSAPHSTFSSSRFTNSTLDTDSTYSECFYASLPGPGKQLESGSNVNNGFSHSSRNSPECTSFKSAYANDVDDFLSHSLRSSASLRSTSENSDSWFTDQASTSISHSISSIEQQQRDINEELEKLRIELRHIRRMHSLAQNEAKDASKKANDLNRLRHEEGVKLKQIKEKEEIAKVLERLEKEKYEAAKREAEYARECAVREALQRREADLKGARALKEKQKLKNVISGPLDQYRTFTWEEIVSATCSFSEKLKIGEGTYGIVYKCMFQNTLVAIKVLHSKEGDQSKQFCQELERLHKVRHPHLLLLLGACPEQGCLVYEYMANGSLEDRLFRKNNTPPIPWYERFRIALEVASALTFLHNNKPSLIIHSDLKPSNILLDRNYLSKIGDVGLSTMKERKEERPVKADINALGIIILQLLTAKPAAGITQFVEDAIKECCLMDILDKDAGKWPFAEAAEMALLGVKCAGIGCRDRLNLEDKVLPILERIQDIAEKARDVAADILVAPPSHFICPILQGVMEDPCVASDGYTYDRKAIELWVKDNDTSPTTNFPLANKHLIPNYSLLYAIMEWKSKGKLRTEKKYRTY